MHGMNAAMKSMNDATENALAAIAMLDRAERVLELTYRDWSLDEQPAQQGRGARSRRKKAQRAESGFSAKARRGRYAFA